MIWKELRFVIFCIPIGLYTFFIMPSLTIILWLVTNKSIYETMDVFNTPINWLVNHEDYE